MDAIAIIVAAAISSVAAVIVAVVGRRTRKDVREVQDKITTRNGETIGEVISDLYEGQRKTNERIKGLEEIQDDAMEGIGWLAVELGKHQLEHERKKKIDG